MVDGYVEVHPAFIGIVATAFFGVLGLVWWQLNNRLRQVEDWKVDKGFCKTQGKLLDERFHGVDARFDDWLKINTRDHERIDGQLVYIRASMEEIRDCVNKIANQKEC